MANTGSKICPKCGSPKWLNATFCRPCRGMYCIKCHGPITGTTRSPNGYRDNEIELRSLHGLFFEPFFPIEYLGDHIGGGRCQDRDGQQAGPDESDSEY